MTCSSTHVGVPMKKIAPSILSADFSRLGEEVRAVEEAGADAIHVDVMDGHFVPNITIGPLVVEGLRKLTSLPLDVHLMIEKPDRYIEPFAQAGSTWLTFHVEVCSRLRSVIKKVRQLNVRPGVVLNPSTPLKTLHPILGEIDLVLLMSVNPGFGGQQFIPQTLPKISHLREMIEQRELHCDIEVDGGIYEATVPSVVQAGAKLLVAGSAVYNKQESVTAAIARLRNALR